MSDDSNWLKNPILPRPPAVPYFEPEDLQDVSDSDRRILARTYARESRRRRARRESGPVVIGRDDAELAVAVRRSA